MKSLLYIHRILNINGKLLFILSYSMRNSFFKILCMHYTFAACSSRVMLRNNYRRRKAKMTKFCECYIIECPITILAAWLTHIHSNYTTYMISMAEVVKGSLTRKKSYKKIK